MDSRDVPVKAGASGRRLLFWIVIGVALLNLILFLKFGLIDKGGERPPAVPSNDPGTVAGTNANGKP